jgi:hypothetical protein
MRQDGELRRNDAHAALYALLAEAEGCGTAARSAWLAADDEPAAFLYYRWSFPDISKSRMRALITVTPQMYRQAIALSIQRHRPGLEVRVAAPQGYAWGAGGLPAAPVSS